MNYLYIVDEIVLLVREYLEYFHDFLPLLFLYLNKIYIFFNYFLDFGGCFFYEPIVMLLCSINELI